MNSAPKITVLLSVHNGQAYLEAALQSIIGQTFNDFECLVIDDCSTDRSGEIIRTFREQDNRIQLIENTPRLGLTKSLNKGLAVARGSFIARLDADDLCQPNRFEWQVSYLEQHPEIFLCATEFDYIDNENNVIERKITTTLTSDDIAKKLGRKNCLLHPTIMFRNDGSRYRDKFVYSQDYDFYLIALSQQKRLALLLDKLVLYRWSPDAISHQMRPQQHFFMEAARRMYHERETTGQDSYDAFQPETIGSGTDNPNAAESLQIELITFYLQNGQNNKARVELANPHRPIKSFGPRILLRIFVTFPWLYRCYRYFRYRHDEPA